MNRGKKSRRIHGIGNLPHVVTGLEALANSGALYLIVGGIAANLHGLASSTKDIDILIPKDTQNAAKLLKGLENLMFGMSREILPEEVTSKPFTIIGDIPRVDLLLRAGKIKFDDAYSNRIEKKVGGLRLPVVSFEDLIRSKETGRAQDKITTQRLLRLKRLKKKIKPGQNRCRSV